MDLSNGSRVTSNTEDNYLMRISHREAQSLIFCRCLGRILSNPLPHEEVSVPSLFVVQMLCLWRPRQPCVSVVTERLAWYSPPFSYYKCPWRVPQSWKHICVHKHTHKHTHWCQTCRLTHRHTQTHSQTQTTHREAYTNTFTDTQTYTEIHKHRNRLTDADSAHQRTNVRVWKSCYHTPQHHSY